MMNIVNLLSQAFAGNRIQAGRNSLTPVSDNPFSNPFVSSEERNKYHYAQNKPIQGGYFAGYYNGQPNIVGQRLFIEA